MRFVNCQLDILVACLTIIRRMKEFGSHLFS